jgi:hypothetical protein
MIKRRLVMKITIQTMLVLVVLLIISLSCAFISTPVPTSTLILPSSTPIQSTLTTCERLKLTTEECANDGKHLYLWVSHVSGPKNCFPGGPEKISLNIVFSDASVTISPFSNGTFTKVNNNLYQNNQDKTRKINFSINGFTLENISGECVFVHTYNLIG